MASDVFIHAAKKTRLFGPKAKHGCSKEDLPRSLTDLLVGVAREALDSCPVAVDAVYVSNQFIPNGEAELLATQIAERLRWSDTKRLFGGVCARIETGTNSLAALELACDRIASGRARSVLLIGGEKLSVPEDDPAWSKKIVERIASAMAPNDVRNCGNLPTACAIVLNNYIWSRRLDYASVVELVRRLTSYYYERVRSNPSASHRIHYLLRNGVLNYIDQDTVIAEPIQRCHMSHYADGAGALILASEQTITDAGGTNRQASVVIKGCATAEDTLSLVDRPVMHRFPATIWAARRAYQRAGFDVRGWKERGLRLLVEDHNTASPLTLMNLQDLLLFDDHHQVKDELLRVVDFRGDPAGQRLWLNPSGGLLAGHPLGGSAIMRLVEVHDILKDGRRDTAIVHSFAGMGATASVALLESVESAGAIRRNPGRPRQLAPLPPVLEAQPDHVLEGRGRVVSSTSLPDSGIERYLTVVETQHGNRFYATAKAGSNQLAPDRLSHHDVNVATMRRHDSTEVSSIQASARASVEFRSPHRCTNPISGVVAVPLHKDMSRSFDHDNLHNGIVVISDGRAARETQTSIVHAIDSAPQNSLIILPELSVPRSSIKAIGAAAERMRSTVIGGLEHATSTDSRSLTQSLNGIRHRIINEFAVIESENPPFTQDKNRPAIMQHQQLIEPIDERLPPRFARLEARTPNGERLNIWPIVCVDLLGLDKTTIDSVVRLNDIDLIVILSLTGQLANFRNKLRELYTPNPHATPTNVAWVNLGQFGGTTFLNWMHRQEIRNRFPTESRPGVTKPWAFDDWTLARSAASEERKRSR